MNRFTIDDFAKKTGYSAGAVYDNIAKGKINSEVERRGGRAIKIVVISDEELAVWLKGKKK